MKLEDIKEGMRVRVDNLSTDVKPNPGVGSRMRAMLGEEHVVTAVGVSCAYFERYSWAPEWLEPADTPYLKIVYDGVENMIDEEKKFVEAGVEVDEERLKEERTALVESLRAEFWKPKIGGRILFVYGASVTEGTVLALSPSRERVNVEFTVFSKKTDAYLQRTEWLHVENIIEFLPNKE